jgi:hypothetical protein
MEGLSSWASAAVLGVLGLVAAHSIPCLGVGVSARVRGSCAQRCSSSRLKSNTWRCTAAVSPVEVDERAREPAHRLCPPGTAHRPGSHHRSRLVSEGKGGAPAICHPRPPGTAPPPEFPPPESHGLRRKGRGADVEALISSPSSRTRSESASVGTSEGDREEGGEV